MDQTNPPQEVHPHSKLLLIITILVVISAIAGSGYYFYQAKHIKKNSVVTTDTAKTTPTPTPAPSATATPAPTGTQVTQSAKETSTTISKDMSAINLDEVKSAMTTLRTAMSSFSL